MGWRAWNLAEDHEGPALLPAGSGIDAWPRRRPLEARCAVPSLLKPRGKPHRVPEASCRCGIHAGRSLDVFTRGRPAWPPPPVLGRVSLWGRTVEHERGWRSRVAYPSRIRLVCAWCAWVEPGAGTASVVHRFGDMLYGLCDEHRGGIEVPDGRRTQPTDIHPGALQARLLEAYAIDPLPHEALEAVFRRPAAPERPGYMPTIRPVSAADPGK